MGDTLHSRWHFEPHSEQSSNALLSTLMAPFRSVTSLICVLCYLAIAVHCGAKGKYNVGKQANRHKASPARCKDTLDGLSPGSLDCARLFKDAKENRALESSVCTHGTRCDYNVCKTLLGGKNRCSKNARTDLTSDTTILPIALRTHKANPSGKNKPCHDSSCYRSASGHGCICKLWGKEYDDRNNGNFADAWARAEGMAIGTDLRDPMKATDQIGCPDGIGSGGTFAPFTHDTHGDKHGAKCISWASDFAIHGKEVCQDKDGTLTCTRAAIRVAMGTRAGMLIQKRVKCEDAKDWKGLRMKGKRKCSTYKSIRCLVIPQGKISISSPLAKLYFPGGYWPNLSSSKVAVSTKQDRKQWTDSLASGGRCQFAHLHVDCLTKYAEDFYRARKLWARAAIVMLQVNEATGPNRGPEFFDKYLCDGSAVCPADSDSAVYNKFGCQEQKQFVRGIEGRGILA